MEKLKEPNKLKDSSFHGDTVRATLKELTELMGEPLHLNDNSVIYLWEQTLFLPRSKRWKTKPQSRSRSTTVQWATAYG